METLKRDRMRHAIHQYPVKRLRARACPQKPDRHKPYNRPIKPVKAQQIMSVTQVIRPEELFIRTQHAYSWEKKRI
jgi:hypothetical protein